MVDTSFRSVERASVKCEMLRNERGSFFIHSATYEVGGRRIDKGDTASAFLMNGRERVAQTGDTNYRKMVQTLQTDLILKILTFKPQLCCVFMSVVCT